MDAEKQFSFSCGPISLKCLLEKMFKWTPSPLPHPPPPLPPYRFHKMPDNADTIDLKVGTPGILFVCSFHFRELKVIETSVCLLFPSPPPSPPPPPPPPSTHLPPTPPPHPRWTMDAEKQFSFQERIKILEVFTGKKCSTGPPPPLPHPPPPYRFHKMPDNADTKTQRLGTPGTLFVCSFHFRELKVIETSVCLLLPSPPSSPSSPPPPHTNPHQPLPTNPPPPYSPFRWMCSSVTHSLESGLQLTYKHLGDAVPLRCWT